MRTHITKVWMAIINKSSKNPGWRGPREKDTLPKVQVGWNGCTLFREHCAGAFKGKLELPMIHSPMPVRIPQENQNPKRCLQSCTSVPLQKQRPGSQRSFHWEINALKRKQYMPTMEWDSPMKQKEIIPTAGTHRDLVLSIQRDVTQEKRQISYYITYKN